MRCRFIFSLRNDRACVKHSLAKLEHHLTWPQSVQSRTRTGLAFVALCACRSLRGACHLNSLCLHFAWFKGETLEASI